MNAEEWFNDLLKEGETDPDYLTEELLLEVTEQIYKRMQHLDLRQKDLAERLGVSASFVSQLLNGRPNMTMRTLVGVAHALGQKVTISIRDESPADEFNPQMYRDVVPLKRVESDRVGALAA